MSGTDAIDAIDMDRPVTYAIDVNRPVTCAIRIAYQSRWRR
jgi:hypothetical protein